MFPQNPMSSNKAFLCYNSTIVQVQFPISYFFPVSTQCFGVSTKTTWLG